MRPLRLLLCCVLFAGACTPPEEAPRATVPENPEEILQAAIAYIADREVVPIAVLDTSFRVETVLDTAFLALDSVVNRVDTFIELGDVDLVRTFLVGVPPGFPLPLLDRDDVGRAPPTLPGERIDYSTLPKGRALGLTRPAVSADGSTAILEYLLNCNAVMRVICGHGGWMILERRDGEWVVARTIRRWVA